jgi:NADPH2:quinone reductase
MRSLQCLAYSMPPVLEFVDRPVPSPGPGQLAVRVEAVGLGFVDALLCAGRYQVKPPLPYTPGSEVAGTIVGVGDGVSGFSAGERVAGLAAGGGLAEVAIIDTALAVPLSDAIDAATAAGAVTNYSACYYGLVELGQARAGETALVLGAGGGIGLAALDLGRALGVRTIALASSADKRAAAIAQGASLAVDGSAPDWRETLEREIGKGAIDIVVDPVGGDASETAFRMLAPGGRHLVIGFASGDIPRLPLNLPLLKRASLVGVDWGGEIRANPARFADHWAPVLAMIGAGTLTPAFPPAVAMEEVADALARLARREWQGKLVVEMGAR